MKKTPSRTFCLTVIVIGALILTVYQFAFSKKIGEEPLNLLYDAIITRSIGIAVFAVLLAYLGYNVTNPFRKPFGKSLLIMLPCFVVTICNPPILGLLTGEASIDYSGSLAFGIAVFAVQCIAVATFEEFAFRGVVLLAIMERRRKTNLDIFVSILLSSAVFGVTHLLNVIGNWGSIGAVLLQICYSFLIGGMCAFVLIKTANIWLCVLLHSTFNFCGTLVQTFGTDKWNTLPIMTFTIVLGVAVFAYVMISLFRLDPKITDKIYPQK